MSTICQEGWGSFCVWPRKGELIGGVVLGLGGVTGCWPGAKCSRLVPPTTTIWQPICISGQVFALQAELPNQQKDAIITITVKSVTGEGFIVRFYSVIRSMPIILILSVSAIWAFPQSDKGSVSKATDTLTTKVERLHQILADLNDLGQSIPTSDPEYFRYSVLNSTCARVEAELRGARDMLAVYEAVTKDKESIRPFVNKGLKLRVLLIGTDADDAGTVFATSGKPALALIASRLRDEIRQAKTTLESLLPK
jgi:hypothetical protein